MPALERRTNELVRCIERRQAESETGLVDLKEALSHWAFDYTVCPVSRSHRRQGAEETEWDLFWNAHTHIHAD